MQLDDTIVAVATAPGGAARGIVRISGPAVADCLSQCSPVQFAQQLFLTAPHVITCEIPLPQISSTPLPCDIYYWPGSRSYTRQPVAELHTLGSPPLVAALLRRLCEAGARPARPGEFTLRAFLAGRIDLTQAEAVLGVIDARGESELQSALSQLAGGLATPLQQLRSDLLDLLAHLEAGLDFVEEDIEFITAADLDATLAISEAHVAELASQMDSRSEVQDAIRIVLIGRPNAGKSSLYNALLNSLTNTSNRIAKSNMSHPAAIVSHEAGTTRDYLSAKLELSGVPVELIDTAGIDPAIVSDAISYAAQDHAKSQQAFADVRILCIDGSNSLSDWDIAQLEELQAAKKLERPSTPAANRFQTLLAWTKCDIQQGDIQVGTLPVPEGIQTSGHTGQGIAKLVDALSNTLTGFAGSAPQPVASTVVRCHESLRQAKTALAAARHLAQTQTGEELVAWEVRSALDAIGNVIGAIYTDDVLDRVFSRFCIGK